MGYIHAVAHSLSGKYDLPHGFTNAVLLPNVLEYYGPAIHGKLAELASAAGIREEEPHKAAEAFIAAIRMLNEEFAIPTYFKELRMEDIPELSRTADREANPLYPVPVLMDGQELEKIYTSVLFAPPVVLGAQEEEQPIPRAAAL